MSGDIIFNHADNGEQLYLLLWHFIFTIFSEIFFLPIPKVLLIVFMKNRNIIVMEGRGRECFKDLSLFSYES